MKNLQWILPITLLAACGGSPQMSTGSSVPSQHNTKTSNIPDDLRLRTNEPAKVYGVASDEVSIAIVPVVHRGKDAFLITVSGLEADTAAPAYRHGLIYSREDSGRYQKYETVVDGENYSLLTKDSQSYDASWKIGLPGQSWKAVSLYFDKTASESFDSAYVVKQYQRDYASGKIKEITNFSRTKHIEQGSKFFETAITKLQAACGSVEASIQWDDASDELLSEHRNIANLCSSGIDAVADTCTRYPEAKEKVKSAGKIVCRIADVPGNNAGYKFAGSSIEYRLFSENSSRIIQVAAREFFDEKETLLQYKDHLVLIGVSSIQEGARPIFAGSAATGLIRQDAAIGSAPGARGNDYSVWAATDRAELKRNTDTNLWSLTCGDITVPLKTLDGKSRRRLLKSAKQKEETWKHEPYLLARDDNGVYYYVDKWKEKYGGRHFRVFIGRRGQQKLSKLTGVVSDSQGTIFSTRSGDLRLVVNRRGGRGAKWIQGKRAPKELTLTDPRRNRTLIYEELGAYLGQEFGHICEF